MTGSADVVPGYGPEPRVGRDLADAAPPASGSPAARDGVDTPGGEAPPGPAGGADSGEPFPDEDGGGGGRYVPL
jgi:hypothetical protein